MLAPAAARDAGLGRGAGTRRPAPKRLRRNGRAARPQGCDAWSDDTLRSRSRSTAAGEVSASSARTDDSSSRSMDASGRLTLLAWTRTRCRCWFDDGRSVSSHEVRIAPEPAAGRFAVQVGAAPLTVSAQRPAPLGPRRPAGRQAGPAADRGPDAWKDCRVLVSRRRGVRAPAGRRDRSDEDGERAARQPRRHRRRDSRPGRSVGRGRRAAGGSIAAEPHIAGARALQRCSARSWRRFWRLQAQALRYLGIALAIIVAILAAAVVSTLTIDLARGCAQLAEREGSQRLNRAVHIGRLSIHVLRGRVVLEDFAIDGRAAGDRPFFTAKRLSVSLDWSSAIARGPSSSSHRSS